jgi:hypothetical protein
LQHALAELRAGGVPRELGELNAFVGIDAGAALKAYEAARLPPTSRIVLQNRSAPPNVIVDTVEQRTGGQRFDKLEDVISQDEMRTIFERYQKVAGYHVQQVGRAQG